MEIILSFLNKKDNETLDQFRARYLGAHKDKVLSFGVEKYSANVCTQPSDELVKAGWGVYPSDQNVFEAFDEVWTDDVDRLIKLYDDENLICVYRVEENVVEVPVGRKVEWDGVTEILYWDVNAFKYGHFSQPDSRQVLGTDCKEFIGPGMTLLFKEHIMKR